MPALARSFFLSLFLLAPACSGGDDGSDGADGGSGSDAGDEAARCEPGEVTTDLEAHWVSDGGGTSTLRSHRIDQPLARGGDLVVPIAVERANGTLDVSMLERDGTVTAVASLADTSPQGFAAIALQLGDRSCVAYQGFSRELELACDDGSVEQSGLEADREHLIAAAWDDGTLSVFTQTFASFTEFRRTPGGQWSEVQKFESSISWPVDAVVHNGTPLVCFISLYDRAVIDGTGLYSAQETSDCQLAATDDALHIVTGNGYAKVAWSEVSVGTDGPYEEVGPAIEQTVLDLVVAGDDVYAVLRNDERSAIEVLNLGSGERAIAFTLPEDSLHGSEVAYDDATGSLLWVYSTLSAAGPPEPEQQTIHFATACADDWP